MDDQRFAAARPDVLVYQTEPLDADVTAGRPVAASLRVSTTGTDSGLGGEADRRLPERLSRSRAAGRRRAGATYRAATSNWCAARRCAASSATVFEKPEPFVPGQVTKVEYAMPDVYHTFRTGHRIMVQVQSSWFPLVDRNPQTFVNINTAKAADFQKATQRVYHSKDAPSSITVRVLGGRDK